MPAPFLDVDMETLSPTTELEDAIPPADKLTLTVDGPTTNLEEVSQLSPPKLPQELCDLIIDFSAHREGVITLDPRAAFVCALTCRSWYYRAKHYLFGSIAINPSRLSYYIGLLQSYPDCGRAIKSLGIYELPLASTLARLPNILSNLEWLNIEDARMDSSLSHPLFPRILRNLQSTQHLSLFSLQFHSTTDLVRLIGAFPRLRSLDLRKCTFAHELVDTPRVLRNTMSGGIWRLEELKIHGQGSTGVLTWMAATPRVTDSPRAFRITAPNLQLVDQGHLANVLRTYGASLGSCLLGMQHFDEGPTPAIGP